MHNQSWRIRALYSKEKKSAREIAKELGITIDAVYYSLRKQSVARRGTREQNILRFALRPPSFTIKRPFSAFDEQLFVAGVMLYWAEGSQWRGEKSVDFANSNPQMVQVFIRFLRTICGVTAQRLRCYLYCYQNQDIEKIIRFWSRLTGIPKTQFTQPYIRTDYKVEKTGKMPYGLIHIRYSDKKLLALFREWIKTTSLYFVQPTMGRYRSGQTGLTVNKAAFLGNQD